MTTENLAFAMPLVLLCSGYVSDMRTCVSRMYLARCGAFFLTLCLYYTSILLLGVLQVPSTAVQFAWCGDSRVVALDSIANKS